MKKWTGLLFALLLLASCTEMDPTEAMLGENAELLGTWVEKSHENLVTVMERAESLDPDKYGFIIRADGVFIERKNAEWCATPPISYDNFEGTWEALSDSLLEITVGYWGGTMTYQMRILSLDEQFLEIRYLYAEDRAEN